MSQRNQSNAQSEGRAFSGATATRHSVSQAHSSRSALPIISSFEDQRVSARLIGEMQQRLTDLRKRCLKSVKSGPEDGREAWFNSMLYEGNSLLQQAREVLVRGTLAETNELLTETQEVIHRIELSV